MQTRLHRLLESMAVSWLGIPLEISGESKANRTAMVAKLPIHAVATIERIHLELIEGGYVKGG
jgi:hypothetical protein